MKTYLKQNLVGANGVKAYNQKNLTSIEYFQCGNEIQCIVVRYDDIADLKDSLNRDLGNGDFDYSESNREQFNIIAIEFGKSANLVNAEL